MSTTFDAHVACTATEPGYFSPQEIEVNMNTRNAAMVCDVLGIKLAPDYIGEMDAADFQGRVLVALALAPLDEGMPAYEHTGPGARMVEGARRPGYLQERLRSLHALAVWAVERGAQVRWG